MPHKYKKLHHHRARRDEKDITPDNSSCIAAAYYTPRGGGVLTVEFVKGGGVYQYGGIDRDTANDVRDGGGEALNDEVL